MKKRLFVIAPGTDDTWLYCGGPDLEDALRGLMNVIREDVRSMFDGKENQDGFSIDLELRVLTDDDVSELADI